MEQARALVSAGKKVGVMFGPERAGLENDDISRANAIISVPVNPEFASLNLAQCVLLMGYEWRRIHDETPEMLYQTGKSDMATGEDVERRDVRVRNVAMLEHVVETVRAAGRGPERDVDQPHHLIDVRLLVLRHDEEDLAAFEV